MGTSKQTIGVSNRRSPTMKKVKLEMSLVYYNDVKVSVIGQIAVKRILLIAIPYMDND